MSGQAEQLQQTMAFFKLAGSSGASSSGAARARAAGSAAVAQRTLATAAQQSRNAFKRPGAPAQPAVAEGPDEAQFAGF